MNHDGHTVADWHAIRGHGEDPSTFQPRERAVPCRIDGCGELTWHVAGCCARHYVAPAPRSTVEAF